MGVPSPTIPSFTDGTVVHQGDLNALASNLTNLYLYNNAGFRTQRPCVIANQTTGQAISSNTSTLINFQNASVNTDNMWVSSVANQITIQHAGIYLVFSQVISTNPGSPTFPTNWLQTKILANGTDPFANPITLAATGFTTSGDGTGLSNSTVINLAAGATLYLSCYMANTGQTLKTTAGGSFLGAIFLTPST